MSNFFGTSEFSLSIPEMKSLLECQSGWTIAEACFYLSGRQEVVDYFGPGMSLHYEIYENFQKTTVVDKNFSQIHIDDKVYPALEVFEDTVLPVEVYMKWVELNWDNLEWKDTTGEKVEPENTTFKRPFPMIYSLYKDSIQVIDSDYLRDANWLVEKGVPIDSFIRACAYTYRTYWDCYTDGNPVPSAKKIEDDLANKPYIKNQNVACFVQRFVRPKRYSRQNENSKIRETRKSIDKQKKNRTDSHS